MQEMRPQWPGRLFTLAAFFSALRAALASFLAAFAAFFCAFAAASAACSWATSLLIASIFTVLAAMLLRAAISCCRICACQKHAAPSKAGHQGGLATWCGLHYSGTDLYR
jgi:hypothetical protein